MSYILKTIGKSTNVSVNTYEADTLSDLDHIDVTHVGMGARCYVIDNGTGVGEWYALNSQGQWKAVPSGGGVTPSPGEDVIYDGGSIDD